MSLALTYIRRCNMERDYLISKEKEEILDLFLLWEGIEDREDYSYADITNNDLFEMIDNTSGPAGGFPTSDQKKIDLCKFAYKVRTGVDYEVDLHVGEVESSIDSIQEAIGGLLENQEILKNLLDIFDVEEVPNNIKDLLEVKFGEM
jgi:hypothetical protein